MLESTAAAHPVLEETDALDQTETRNFLDQLKTERHDARCKRVEKRLRRFEEWFAESFGTQPNSTGCTHLGLHLRSIRKGN